MMQPGLMDYVDGEYKVIDLDSMVDSISVHHSLKGDSLVSQYVLEGKAVFATEVSSPHSTYRKTFKHEWEETEPSLEVKQSFSVDREKMDGPVFYRPLVAVKESIKEERIRLQAEHGVHELFYGQEMLIRPGTILARDVFWNSEDYRLNLFEIDENKNLKKGSFEVKEVPDKGFYFRVELAPDLYRFVKNARGDQYDFKEAILTFAFSEGLNIIYRDYREEDAWTKHLALRSLYERIHEEGLDAWDSDNFKPEKIVTTLKPINGALRDDEND